MATDRIAIQLLLIGAFFLNACKSVHLAVKTDRFVYCKQGYVLLNRPNMDTSYSDDVYMNRQVNAKNRFSLLFFETKVDTVAVSDQETVGFLKQQNKAMELGTICEAKYESLIAKYADTISNTARGFVFIIPVNIRYIKERKGITSHELISVDLNNNLKRDLTVESGRITLVSIDPIINRKIIERLQNDR